MIVLKDMTLKFARATGFERDEEGAVTVDWVVLTATLVTLAVIMWQIINGGIIEAASDIRQGILDATADL